MIRELFQSPHRRGGFSDFRFLEKFWVKEQESFNPRIAGAASLTGVQPEGR